MSMNITNFLSFAKTTPSTDSLYVIQKSLLSGEANNITMLTDEEMEATILELASMGV